MNNRKYGKLQIDYNKHRWYWARIWEEIRSFVNELFYFMKRTENR